MVAYFMFLVNLLTTKKHSFNRHGLLERKEGRKKEKEGGREKEREKNRHNFVSDHYIFSIVLFQCISSLKKS